MEAKMNQIIKLNCSQILLLLLTSLIFQLQSFAVEGKTVFKNANNVCDITVSGIVHGVWGANGEKTICVNNDITIPSDSVLKILPGTTIRFYANTKFEVYGKLEAQGNDSNRIIFESYTRDEPVNADWQGIYFSTDEVPIIDFCEFYNVWENDEGTNNPPVLYFDRCNFVNDFEITNCIFSENGCGAFYMDGPEERINLKFKNNVINCSEYGLKIKGGYFNNISLINNTIKNIVLEEAFNGVYFDDLSATNIFMDGLDVNGAYPKDADFGKYSFAGSGIYILGAGILNQNNRIDNIVLVNSKITNNRGNFGAVNLSCKSRIEIDNTIIATNRTKLGGLMASSKNCSISNTLFVENRPFSDDGGGGIWLNLQQDESDVYIHKNTFLENSIYNNSGAALRINGNGNSAKELKFENCIFENNQNGGAVAISEFELVENIEFDSNRFVSNQSNYNGAAVSVENIGHLDVFKFHNSTAVKGNTSTHSGGVLSLKADLAGEFVYQYNNHGDKVNVAGDDDGDENGGIINLDVDELNTFKLSYNDSVFCTADGAGGMLHLNADVVSQSVQIDNNYLFLSKAGKSGGSFNIQTQNTIKNIKLEYNRIDRTEAVLDGGYLNLVAGNTENIEIKNDSIGVAGSMANVEGMYNLPNGGSFNIYCVDELGEFNFENNQVENSYSAGNGGVLNVHAKNYLSEKYSFAGNTVTRSYSDLNGGFVYFDGNKLTPAQIELNNNSFGVVGAKKNGGVVAFKDKILECKNLDINGNVIDSVYSISGMGGFLHLDGKVNERIKITYNKKKSDNGSGYCSALKNGGGFNIINSSELPIDFEFKYNEFAYVASNEGNGGLVFLKTDNINDFNLDHNNINEKAYAMLNGGLLYLDLIKSGKIQITYNSINSSESENGYGGAFCIGDTVLSTIPRVESIGRLSFHDNNFANSFSAGYEGGICFINSGKTGDFNVSRNTIGSDNEVDELKAINGGFLCVRSEFDLSNILINDTIRIRNNKFKSIKADVQNNGGIFYLHGLLNRDLKVEGNSISGSINEVNNGGVIFVHNSHGINDSIVFRKNTLDLEINTDNGGFVYFEGFYKNRNFNFIGNKLNDESEKTVKVDSLGGVICIRNIFLPDTVRHDSIIIKNNAINNIDIGLKGGILSYQGQLDSSFIFDNNAINKIRKIDGKENMLIGGVVFIEDTLNINSLKSFRFNRNTINDIDIENNSRTSIADYRSTGIESVKFWDNKVGMEAPVRSSEFGLFHFNTDSIAQFDGIQNKFYNVEGGKGGVYSFEGKENSKIDNFTLVSDRFTNIKSVESGGAVYFDIDSIGILILENIFVDGVEAKSDGGFLKAKEGIKIDSLQIITKNDNEINNCLSENGNGGFIYLNGRLNKINIDNIPFGNVYAENGNGGIFFLKGFENDSIENLKIANCSFINDSASLKESTFITGKTGGVLHSKFVKQLQISNNTFDYIQANNSGGAFYLDSIGKIVVNKNHATFGNSIQSDGGFLYVNNSGEVKTSENKLNSVFAENGKGGAVYIENSDLSMLKDTLVYNLAMEGAGAYLKNAFGTIDSCCFNNNNYNYNPPINQNIIQRLGGAVYAKNKLSADTLSIKNSQFFRNTAVDGTALYFDSINVKLIRNIFGENGALKERGGACIKQLNSNIVYFNNGFVPGRHLTDDTKKSAISIHIKYTENLNKPSNEIINCSFRWSNEPYIKLDFDNVWFGNKVLKIKNSVFSDNYATNAPGEKFYFDFGNLNSSVELSYSCLHGENDLSSCNNCTSSNPEYTSLYNFCYRISGQLRSPCINAGDPNPMYFDRVDGSRNDMGITGGKYMFENCEDLWFDVDLACCLTNTEEIDSKNELFRIYPNPANDKVNIEFSEFNPETTSIQLFSLTGQLLKNMLYKNNNKRTINIGDLVPGTYILKIGNGNISKTTKLIKF